jgi:hypothetical protein
MDLAAEHDRIREALDDAVRTVLDSSSFVLGTELAAFTGAEIAECLGMALSTVSGVLTRIGMRKRGRIGLEPAQRYERARLRELIHIDVKKLGRIESGAGHRVTGLERVGAIREGQTPKASAARRSVGNAWTSPSMTARAWPTQKCSARRRDQQRSGF